MENMEKRTGFCPNCNKELTVPADLESFSCMYCGTVLTQDELMAKAAVFDADALEDAAARMSGCILENIDLMKRFNKKEYAPSFEEYTEKCRPLFEVLDESFIAAGEAGGEKIKNDVVKRIMDDISAHVKAAAKINLELEHLRFVIALYFVPMVKSLGLKVSDPFCVALREEWIKTYPKFSFEIGTYELIAGGFRKKLFGICYITTAVCEYSGKPDDCYELTAFRSFRDGYLASSEGGRELIEEYYETAPVIVTCIDLLGEKDAVYPMLRKKYLSPCLEDIEAGRFESCKNRYVEMVRSLQSRYLKQ